MMMKKSQSSEASQSGSGEVRDAKGRYVRGVAQETNKNGTAGQPTKYKKRYCQDILDYFNVDVVERIVDDPSGRGGTSTHFETIRVPSIEGFAGSIGVSRDTIYEWAKVNPDFSDSLAKVQTIQMGMMFEYGAAGRLNSALTALYWTNKLGYKQKTESEVNLKTEQPLLGGSVQLQPDDDIPADDGTPQDQDAS